jgi:hypothetical protein
MWTLRAEINKPSIRRQCDSSDGGDACGADNVSGAVNKSLHFALHIIDNDVVSGGVQDHRFVNVMHVVDHITFEAKHVAGETRYVECF